MKNSNKNRLLFVVEDSSVYRTLLVRVLEAKGFRVMSFEKLADAVQSLSIHTPDAFISDIEMPEINGFELYNMVTSLYPTLKIPFMYISSTSSEEYKVKASKLGATAMLGKPVSRDSLFNSLNKVLNSVAA
ncbi:MAG: response regulator [Balneolaceae bacterium]|nr:response regulator [Balneolaceae bacterium]